MGNIANHDWNSEATESLQAKEQGKSKNNLRRCYRC